MLLSLILILIVAPVVALIYLRKRIPPWAFASVAAAIGLGIYALGILSTRSWYDAQLAQDRVVDGKGLFDTFFFLSALSALWLSFATSSLIANAPVIRGKRIVEFVSASALFLLTLVATIPTGILVGFALVR